MTSVGRTVRLLALLAGLLAAGVLACQEGSTGGGQAGAASATRTDARVVRVVDGDTLLVRLGDARRVRVRLIGIDTPETKRPDTPVQCGGPQASAAMRRLVLRGEGPRASGRDVVLFGDPSQGSEDRFGRRLAYVEAIGDDGTRRDAGAALVRSGWARARAYDGRFARQSAYEKAQRAARSERAGIWGLCR